MKSRLWRWLAYSRMAVGCRGACGACYAIQGIARHYTGKWWLVPPWLEITLGSVVFAGTITQLAFGKALKEPAEPEPAPTASPLPTPAFIFKRPDP